MPRRRKRGRASGTNQLPPLGVDSPHTLPLTTTMLVADLPSEHQLIFDREYRARRRSVMAMMVLALLFPIHWFFLREGAFGVTHWGVVIALTIFLPFSTAALVGFAFAVAAVATAPYFTRRYNEDLAADIVETLHTLRGSES